jgi:hypothetical protein
MRGSCQLSGENCLTGILAEEGIHAPPRHDARQLPTELMPRSAIGISAWTPGAGRYQNGRTSSYAAFNCAAA